MGSKRTTKKTTQKAPGKKNITTVYKIRDISTGSFFTAAGRARPINVIKWSNTGHVYVSLHGAESAARYLYMDGGYNQANLEIVSYNLVEVATQPV